MVIYYTINLSPKISLDSFKFISNDKTKRLESYEGLKKSKYRS